MVKNREREEGSERESDAVVIHRASGYGYGGHPPSGVFLPIGRWEMNFS